jgi:hypothetical protein
MQTPALAEVLDEKSRIARAVTAEYRTRILSALQEDAEHGENERGAEFRAGASALAP